MFALVSNYNQEGYKIGEVVETFDSYDDGWEIAKNAHFPMTHYVLIPFECNKGDILGRDGIGKYWVVK